MRHGKRFNHLGRKAGHRKATLKNMATSLVSHKRINTTLAKARALRVYLEPIITKAKTDTTHSRRVVFSYLQDKNAVQELFGPIAAKVGNRPGGYLRIIKTGFRRSDGAETAMIELVDFNEVMLASAGEPKSKKKRSRRGRKKSKAEATPPAIDETNESAAEEESSTDSEEE
ncbi:MAG: 50S ribosomal protein L17 [Saprospiraceae bacterium]|nr:50S ribosomal protein L17 [Saprospiraceae bacterium]